MQTLHTTHLGDGAYLGLDAGQHQVWLGANHHEYMTVALGPREIGNMIAWLRTHAPHIASAAGLKVER